MNESQIKELLEISWRRRLTAEEKRDVGDWLDRNPARRSEYEQALAASQALAQLPDAEVPSNFMSRVWDGVEVAERETAPARAPLGGWRLWLPRWATGMAALLLVAGGWWQYAATQRAEVAQGVMAAADTAETLDPAMLRDFEALQVMTEASAAVDEELLTALQ